MALLLVFAMLLLPLTAHAATPSATLTFSDGKLTWTDSTGQVIKDYKMDVFQQEYETSSGKVIAKSKNGDNLVAPGLSGSDLVQFKNDSTHAVEFTTIVYKTVKDVEVTVNGSDADSSTVDAEALQKLLEDKVDVQTSVKLGSGTENQLDASSVADLLPSGVTVADVVSVTGGSIDALATQDISVSWKWDYEVNADGNITDTILGSTGVDTSVSINPMDVQLGVIVLVEDTYIEPESPVTPAGTGSAATTTTASTTGTESGSLLQTGDVVAISIGVLVAVAVVALIVILATRRRHHQEE
jgi:hypothetical protein